MEMYEELFSDENYIYLKVYYDSSVENVKVPLKDFLFWKQDKLEV
jgi:hypothetical protein